ncbi:MAG: hypothetical protein QW609_02640 [Candidatus Aenigmatarchaeota archaeon]
MMEKIKEISRYTRKIPEKLSIEEIIMFGIKILSKEENSNPICLTSELRMEKQGNFFVIGLYQEFSNYSKLERIWVLDEKKINEICYNKKS